MIIKRISRAPIYHTGRFTLTLTATYTHTHTHTHTRTKTIVPRRAEMMTWLRSRPGWLLSIIKRRKVPAFVRKVTGCQSACTQSMYIGEQEPRQLIDAALTR